MGNVNGNQIPTIIGPSQLNQQLDRVQLHESDHRINVAQSDQRERKKNYLKTYSVSSSFNDHDFDDTTALDYNNLLDRGGLLRDLRNRFKLRKASTKTSQRAASSDLSKANGLFPNRNYKHCRRSMVSFTPLNKCDENRVSYQDLDFSKSTSEIIPKTNESYDTSPYGSTTQKDSVAGVNTDLKSLSINEKFTVSSRETDEALSSSRKKGLSASKNFLERINETASLNFFIGKSKRLRDKKTISYDERDNRHSERSSKTQSGDDSKAYYGSLRKSISCNTLKIINQYRSSGSSKNKSTINNRHLGNNSSRPQLQKGSVSQQEIFEKNITNLSSSEILKCLSNFIFYNCPSLFTREKVASKYPDGTFQPITIALWIRSIDRSLLVQGWSEIPFISPVNMTFLYMLLKDYINETCIKNHATLHSIIMATLYLSYSYMGNEISYPLKPFLAAELNFSNKYTNHNKSRRTDRAHSASLPTSNYELNNMDTQILIDQERDRFWTLCLKIMNEQSSKMLLINSDTKLFMEYFFNLCQYSSSVRDQIFIQPRSHQHPFITKAASQISHHQQKSRSKKTKHALSVQEN